jgi:glycosyltransferase involved in cell wall biosynthesis
VRSDVPAQVAPAQVAPARVAPAQVAPDRVAIDYLSPLPPVRSGISEYSVDLLPALEAELGDRLRVIQLDGQPIDQASVRRFNPVPAARTGEGGRLPVYHMGNNLHHIPLWEVARRIPGILVLHDLVLHHFLVERTLAHGDLEGYIDALEDEHGWAGRAAGLTRRWNAYSEAAHFAFPANRVLCRTQRGIVVHSAWAARQLLADQEGLRVCSIPMGIPAPAPLDREVGQAFRRRHGLPQDAPLLGSFGFQTPIKRTDAVIRALADPRLAHVHLVVVGEEAGAVDLGRLAAEAGVGDRVVRLGYVPFDQLEAAMAACDLSVNLRYPTAGETSASLLRLLAVGRPVMVSDHAQFAELPDHVAVKIPLDFDHEVAVLAQGLGGLLASRDRLLAMGAAARQHVLDHHQPAQAARGLVAACCEWAEAVPLVGPPAPPAPPTTRTWGAIAGTIGIGGLEVWTPGAQADLELKLANTGIARWLAADRGPGGVMVEVALWSHGRNLLATTPWLALPRDVGPGESVAVPLRLRRPPGTCRLVVTPHVSGVASFPALGGPSFDTTLGHPLAAVG